MSGWRVEGGREERRECEALSLLFKVQGPEKCSCPLSSHYNLQFSLVCHLQVCFSHTNAPIVATIKEQEGRMPDFKRSAPFFPAMAPGGGGRAFVLTLVLAPRHSQGLPTRMPGIDSSEFPEGRAELRVCPLTLLFLFVSL